MITPSHAFRRPYAVRSDREKALEAMVRLAAVKGYEPTTVTEIAEAAGISIASFDLMFADKKACFLESYDALFDVLVAHMTDAFEATPGLWSDQVAAALRAMVELLTAEADIARMAMVEVGALGDDARVRYWRSFARFKPFVDAGRDYSAQGHALPPDTATLAVGSVTSLVYDAIRAGRGANLERCLPHLIFAVLVPYLGPETAELEMRRLSAGEDEMGPRGDSRAAPVSSTP